MPRKSSGARKAKINLPPDVAAITAKLVAFFDEKDEQGRNWCNAKCGVYAFYDYDGEPIYVGQTMEKLRTRIRRHMTNQRSDAVAMRVLDPLEVADLEVYPIWVYEDLPLNVKENKRRATEELNKAEYTLYQHVISKSKIGRVLNEKIPLKTDLVDLPAGHRGRIIPEEIWERLSHPDERIARRALKISELAGVIRQRDVSVGLRNALIAQAQRLEALARARFDEIASTKTDAELKAELYGPEGDAVGESMQGEAD